jgi:myo-inositol-1(or 4)-monophosphatase
MGKKLLNSDDILQLKNNVLDAFHQVQFKMRNEKNLGTLVGQKEDNSYVTMLDLEINRIFKEDHKKRCASQHEFFFSEEDHSDRLCFPTYLLDPLDGTKEFVRGIPECAVSFSYAHSSYLLDSKNVSWIFNPFNHVECFVSPLSSLSLMAQQHPSPSQHFLSRPLLGLISLTEWDQRMKYSPSWVQYWQSQQIQFSPLGSVAYKLALLSLGLGDFVVSFQKKNIWDIFAGTHALLTKGFVFLHQHRPVDHLEEIILNPPFVWCRPYHAEKLTKMIRSFS